MNKLMSGSYSLQEKHNSVFPGDFQVLRLEKLLNKIISDISSEF